MRRGFWILGWIFGIGSLPAGVVQPIPLADNADAKIEISCFLDDLPSRGYLPLEVKIRNASGAPQKWSFDFSSPGTHHSSSALIVESSTDLPVEKQATRTFSVLVPLSPDLADNPWAGLEASVRGYQTTYDSRTPILAGNYSGSQNDAFVAISTRLGSSLWNELREAMKTGTTEHLKGSLFDPKRLPEDWRGLSGIDALWLTDTELDQLSSAQRDALRVWAQMGGQLTLCGASAVPEDFQNVFFGKVKTRPDFLTVATAKAAIDGLESKPGGFEWVDDTAHEYPGIKPNIPVLISLVILFALIVGPVNIFYFASTGNRHRLFWTTPLISIAASLLIAAFILFQDGIGGQGIRAALIYVMPDEHRQILIQRQTSRTGPLLGNAFQTADPVVMLQQTENDQTRVMKNNDTHFSGDWFSSRSIQTQKIQSVIPSRSEITLLNAAAVQAQSDAPVVTSSFPAPLEELIYEDAKKRRWSARNVRPGEKVTLTPGQPKKSFRDRLNHPVPSRSGAGTFFATNRDSSAFLSTLTSIRWDDKPVVYFGPVSLP